MKSLAPLLAWSFVAGVIICAALNPQSGVIYQSPMSALGLGLIGMGLCMQARKQATAVPVFGRKKSRRQLAA